MSPLTACKLLLVAWVTSVVAQDPNNPPDNTALLFKDTACASFLASVTIDDTFNKCTAPGEFQSYSIGTVPGCADPDSGYYRTFGIYGNVDGYTCSDGSSDYNNARGGGCGIDQHMCQATGRNGNAPAYYIMAGSVSTNLGQSA